MKFYQFINLIFFYFLLFAGCSKDSQLPRMEFDLDQSFGIKVEEKIFNQNKDLSIKIISITEDSRCQKGIFCVNKGQVRIEIELMINNKTTSHYIVYSKGKDLQKRIEGLGIELTNVYPENEIDEDINIEDYVFTMLIKTI